MTTSATRTLTFEEWRTLPETKQKCEIVDGVLYMPPGPNAFHQWIHSVLFSRMAQFGRSSGLGIALSAPMDVLIQRNPLRVRQPDILFLNSERTGIRSSSDLMDMPFIDVPPDVVVEVLSPSNTRREMAGRLSDYQRIGVYQCWLISPEAQTAEIVDLTRPDPVSVAVFSSQETLVSVHLPGFELKLSEIFN